MSASSRVRRGAVTAVLGTALAVSVAGCGSSAPPLSAPTAVPGPTAPGPAPSPTTTPAPTTAPRPTTHPAPSHRPQPTPGHQRRMHTGSFAGEGISPAKAAELQAAVDAGHQPWRLDPASVARTFVASRFGWSSATVAMADPHTAEVTDPGTGSIVVLQLRQPARSGSGGIWVVVSGVWIR